MDMNILNKKLATTFIQSAVKAADVEQIQNKFKISNGFKGFIKNRRNFQVQVRGQL